MSNKRIVAVIGGGAAGFFAALSAKQHFPEQEVIILERTSKVLSKVKISGGGRCNVTHACFDHDELSKSYPRGGKFLRKAFGKFDAKSTFDWFEKRGVALKTFPDNCVFPLSNDSQTIIDCFVNEAFKTGVKIELNTIIGSIRNANDRFVLTSRDKEFEVDSVIITVGGQPKRSGLEWLEHLGLSIVDPVPSLFTFNMPNESIRELMGIVVEEATVKIEGINLHAFGPLLITHWGMSGPAILKLSSWGARIFAEKNYQFFVLVNWLNDAKEETVKRELEGIINQYGMKMMGNLNPFPFPNRLWNFILYRSGINAETRWKDLGTKNSNKLINNLLNDRYSVEGKTTFKEEFVTAGGIDLAEIDVKTMQARKIPGLYVAGEILDIDGVTGGFNFQAAWTSGFIAGQHAGKAR